MYEKYKTSMTKREKEDMKKAMDFYEMRKIVAANYSIDWNYDIKAKENFTEFLKLEVRRNTDFKKTYITNVQRSDIIAIKKFGSESYKIKLYNNKEYIVDKHIIDDNYIILWSK